MKNRVWNKKKRGRGALALALALGIFALSLSGCRANQKEEAEIPPGSGSSQASAAAGAKALTVCLDPATDPKAFQKAFEESAKLVPGLQEAFTLTVESVPGGLEMTEDQAGERENTLTRLRTEIMAGAGPDLFFCVCPRPRSNPKLSALKGLFPYPEAAMGSGLFLPLGDYLGNSKKLDQKIFLPQVLESGKLEGETYLLPLSYTFGVTSFQKGSYSLPQDLPVTYEQQVSSDNTALRQAGHTQGIYSTFGKLADYQKGALTFSQEELLAHMEAHLQFSDVSEEEHSDMRPGFSIGLPNMDPSDSGHDFSAASPEYAFLPQYNTQGGITAYITAFAAVNRNTQYPQEAFAVLETLLSKEGQQSPLFAELYGMPAHRELGSEGSPARGHLGSWYLSENNFAELQKLQGQINAVNFFTPLEAELNDLLHACQEEALSKEELEKQVAEAYRALTMMMGES